jgi:hypothetical protein
MTSSVDPWDEVWDAYEARGAVLTQAPPLPRPAGGAAPPVRRRWLPSLLTAAVFGLGCAAGSAWPVLGLYTLVMRQDLPALLRQIDLSPARDGLRQALLRHAGLSPGIGETAAGGAGRLLAGMAAEMAEDLSAPGALGELVLARREGPWPHRDPAVPPLQRLSPLGWNTTGVALGPAEGQGGFGLELAWENGVWRAVAVQLLDPPAGAMGQASFPEPRAAREPARQAAAAATRAPG